MSAVVLPEGFQYVGAAISSTFLILIYQTLLVGRSRKAAGIKYPQLYAEKAEMEKSKEAMVFNCVQRAHQNSLEVIVPIIGGTVLLAAKYPIPAAALCGTWSFSRIFYTLGYASGNPDKRYGVLRLAGLGSISLLALSLGSAYVWGKAAITGAL